MGTVNNTGRERIKRKWERIATKKHRVHAWQVIVPEQHCNVSNKSVINLRSTKTKFNNTFTLASTVCTLLHFQTKIDKMPSFLLNARWIQTEIITPLQLLRFFFFFLFTTAIHVCASNVYFGEWRQCTTTWVVHRRIECTTNCQN